MKKQVLKQREVAEILGVSRVTVWKMEKEGQIPPRRQITDRKSGWLLHEIEEWLESRPKIKND